MWIYSQISERVKRGHFSVTDTHSCALACVHVEAHICHGRPELLCPTPISELCSDWSVNIAQS